MSIDDMKERLSAFVDNELDELEERRMLAALGEDATLRHTWERYHVARSALHQDLEIVVTRDLAERVAKRIDGEPSGGPSYRHLMRIAGTLALAASVAAVAIIGVQRINKPVETPTAQLAASKPAPEPLIRTGTTRWDTKEPDAENALNAYLIEHNEFASASGIGGMMPYVRVVGYDNDK